MCKPILNNNDSYHLPSSLQVFAKAVATGHAFGFTATAAHAEYLHRRSYRSVYQKIYVKIVGKVLRNEAGNVPLACYRRTLNLYQTNRLTLIDRRISKFIYVGSLHFTIRVRNQYLRTQSFIASSRHSLLVEEDRCV